jgi:arylsulfatase A-like enzyme
LVQDVDLAPTFLALAGVDVPLDVHGRSLVPLLLDQEPDWRGSIYYHYYESNGPHRVAKHHGVRSERYDLVHYYELGEWELFDLARDPDELASVFDDPSYAEVRAEMQSELQVIRDAYADESLPVHEDG